jgi:signal transduction histidine kinase
MGVVESDGAVTCVADNPARVPSVKNDPDREALLTRLARTGSFVIGDVTYGDIVGRPILPLVIGLPNERRSTGRAFEASVDLRWVDRQVNAVPIPRQAALLVMDRRGILAARNPPSAEWRVGLPAPPFERTLTKTAELDGEVQGEGGVKRLYTTARAGPEDALLVVMKIRSAEIYSPSRHLLAIHLAGLASMALLVFGLTWLGSDRYFAGPLIRLIREANRLAAGDLSARSGLAYDGEIGGLARSFDDMAGALQIERTRTQATIAENEEMVRRLRALAARLQSVREEERTHIAREIHDELGQLLTAMRFDVVGLRNGLRDAAVREPTLAPYLDTIAELTGLMDAMIGSVRRIATELRPRVLDTFGLIAAIEWLAEDFEKRMRIPCLYEGPSELETSSELATTLFRICQESLTNAARHSQATEVRIRLIADCQWITLAVADNGRGMPERTSQHMQSFGLQGMRERAAMAGGSLDIDSDLSRGTTILAIIPRAIAASKAAGP